jgi:hypothetical protein
VHRLSACVSVSACPPEHYSQKTGRGLVTIAQIAVIDDAEDCLRSPEQDQQQYEMLIVEDDIEEGTVHVHPAVVLKEAQFAELIHKETDAGACGPDHLGE